MPPCQACLYFKGGLSVPTFTGDLCFGCATLSLPHPPSSSFLKAKCYTVLAQEQRPCALMIFKCGHFLLPCLTCPARGGNVTTIVIGREPRAGQGGPASESWDAPFSSGLCSLPSPCSCTLNVHSLSSPAPRALERHGCQVTACGQPS